MTDQWQLVDGPRSCWAWTWAQYKDGETGVLITVSKDGLVTIQGRIEQINADFIERLQSLKVLARQQFGDDWGRGG